MGLNFQELRDALDTTGGAPIDAGKLGSGSITLLLADFFEGTLLLQPEQPAEKSTIVAGGQTLDSVLVVGTLTSQFLKLSKLKARAEFYLLNEVAELRIALTLPAPWKLSSSFPSLLDTDADKVELHQCVVQADSLRPDRLAADFDALFARPGATPQNPSLNGLTLTAQLKVDSVETTLDRFFAFSDGLLNLEGLLEVAVGPDGVARPRMLLSAQDELGDFAFEKLTLKIGYQFATAPVPVPGSGASVNQQIRQRLTTPLAYAKDTETLEVPLAITFAPDSLREKFTIELDTYDRSKALSFQTLAGMIPGGLGDMLPSIPGFPDLDRVELTDLSLELDSYPLKLNAVQTRVEVATKWEIVPKLITFEKFGLSFTVTREEDKWQVWPSVEGTFQIAGGRMNCVFEVSSKTYLCGLEAGQTVDLKKLFTETLGQPDLFPLPDRFDLTTFVIAGDLDASRYTIDVGTSIDMPIDLGVARVEIKSLFFSLEYKGSAFSGMVGGSLEIAGVTVAIAASYDPAGWTFEAALYKLSLTAILKAILGNTAVAEKLPEVSFPYIEFKVTPASGAFRFAAATEIKWLKPFGLDAGFECNIVLELERAAATNGKPSAVSCDIKVKGRGTLKINDVDVEAVLKVHVTKSGSGEGSTEGTITAGGTLIIALKDGNVSFGMEIVNKADSKRIHAGWPADKNAKNLPLDFKALATRFGMDLTQVPDALVPTLTGASFDYDFSAPPSPTASKLLLAAQTTNTKLFFLTSPKLFEAPDPAAQKRGYLFGIGVDADLRLSGLPVVGKALPSFMANSGLKSLLIIVSSDPVSVEKLNKLLPEGVKQLPGASPGKAGDKASAKEGLQKGFNVSAELLFGDETRSLTLPSPAGAKTLPDSAPQAAPQKAEAAGSTKWFDVNKSLGPVTISRIGLTYEDSKVGLKFDASLQLSLLTFDLDGLGLLYAIGKPLALFENPEFTLDGMGVALSTPSLEIGGSLVRVPNPKKPGDLAYAGALLVRTSLFTFSAFGEYAEVDGVKSVYAFAVLLADLGGDPGFFITGLAFGFGVNRTLRLPPIEKVHDFPLVKAARSTTFTELTELPKQLREYVVSSEGSFWIAAGLKFTSYAMVESFALLSVSWGAEIEIGLLGLSTIQLPPPKVKSSFVIARAELALRAVIFIGQTEGYVRFEAQLTVNSYIFAKECRLTGGFAFCVWFKGPHAGDFVISLGGYHPAFRRPDHYPVVPRLGIHWQLLDTPDAQLSITGEAYFALTPSCIMAGGRLAVIFKSNHVEAWFVAYANFLLSWQPFYYLADMGISIGILLKLGSLRIRIELSVDLKLQGPPFGGEARVTLWIISFTIPFGNAAEEPKALTAPEFVTNCLPSKTTSPAPDAMATARTSNPLPDAHVVSLTVAGGLLREQAVNAQEKIRLVNAFQLSLVAQSVVPCTDFDCPDRKQAASPASEPLGIRPMGMKSLKSTFKVEVTKAGAAAGNTLKHLKAASTIAGNVPDALWGTKGTEGVDEGKVKRPEKPEAKTIRAAVGVRLECVSPEPEHSTPYIKIEKFAYQNVKPRKEERWKDPGEAGKKSYPAEETIFSTIMMPKAADSRKLILDCLKRSGPGRKFNEPGLNELASAEASYFQSAMTPAQYCAPGTQL